MGILIFFRSVTMHMDATACMCIFCYATDANYNNIYIYNNNYNYNNIYNYIYKYIYKKVRNRLFAGPGLGSDRV